jgi:hypothetical protein
MLAHSENQHRRVAASKIVKIMISLRSSKALSINSGIAPDAAPRARQVHNPAVVADGWHRALLRRTDMAGVFR